ncbi:MAG: thioredoxin family protein [Bacteroidetes bacterium]|nr:thioredoxin family protein [Bacteroidota bacterium]
MKRFLLFAALTPLLFVSQLQAQDTPVLVGPLTIADLIELPGWFGEDYLGYQPERRYLDPIPEHMNDVEIVCFLGTWCSDSKRDVPRMIRIFQTKNLAPEKLRLIGLDRAKRSPEGEEARYDIERVPTFIFLRDGEEIGRIVEAPLASIEKDMLGIIDPEAGKGDPSSIPMQIEVEPGFAPDGSNMDADPMHKEAERKRMEAERQRMETDRQRIEWEGQRIDADQQKK